MDENAKVGRVHVRHRNGISSKEEIRERALRDADESFNTLKDKLRERTKIGNDDKKRG